MERKHEYYIAFSTDSEGCICWWLVLGKILQGSGGKHWPSELLNIKWIWCPLAMSNTAETDRCAYLSLWGIYKSKLNKSLCKCFCIYSTEEETYIALWLCFCYIPVCCIIRSFWDHFKTEHYDETSRVHESKMEKLKH